MGRLIRRAAAPRTGFITADDVKRALTEAGYGEFLDEPYRHINWSGVDWQGSWGTFGHQVVGVGVSKPIIFCAEVHTFKDEHNAQTSFIIVHRLKDDGSLNRGHSADVQRFSEAGAVCAKRLDRLYRLLDGKTVKFGFYTFAEAINAAQRYIDERSEQIEKGCLHDEVRSRRLGKG